MRETTALTPLIDFFHRMAFSTGLGTPLFAISPFLSVLSLLSSLSLLSATSAQARPFRVVIDPGHGGRDEGAIYQRGAFRISEKQITLRIALEAERFLQSKGYQVALTRRTDQEVSLAGRTAYANRIHADAFISIHLNSMQRGSGGVEGIETYILNHTTDAASRRLAHLENSVLNTTRDLSSEDQLEVAMILKDLKLDANLARSKSLACQVQTQLISATSIQQRAARRNRGVKQALFHILLGADMPSILVEAGFLGNFHDRSLVLSELGQKKIAKAMADALDGYRYHLPTHCKIN